jgi:hypothetical protein
MTGSGRCSRCGAELTCAMADGGSDPCWCTELPPVVPVPAAGGQARCWCRACLQQEVDRARARAGPAYDELNRKNPPASR